MSAPPTNLGIASVVILGQQYLLAPGAAVRGVDIDIKPGSDPNCFTSDGHGSIPIAILSSVDFDASSPVKKSRFCSRRKFGGQVQGRCDSAERPS